MHCHGGPSLEARGLCFSAASVGEFFRSGGWNILSVVKKSQIAIYTVNIIISFLVLDSTCSASSHTVTFPFVSPQQTTGSCCPCSGDELSLALYDCSAAVER